MASAPSVAIIGAGLSGMATGLRLMQDDVPFEIFEKGSEVGGTWRENRYPGLTIDVPSAIYTFRDYRHNAWKRYLPPQSEILEYFRDVATRSGLRERIRFETPVTAASWNGAAWEVRTADGSVREFRVLVCASGFLHHPRWPAIEGLDTFAGELAHSAQWREEIVTTGRRVGVIGTGSTGVQLVCALAGRASHLTHFQRTAQWIYPGINFDISPRFHRLLERHPALMDLNVEATLRFADWLLGGAAMGPGLRRRALELLVHRHLRSVRDTELRRVLTPPDQPLCKRPVLSSAFYRAVQRDDVSVVPTAIERVTPEGVLTADGCVHELDVLILATGFQAHNYMRPIAITGRDGVTLDEAWADGPHGYRTVTLPGFPNLFMIMGPHSPLVSVSIHESAELQADYVAQMLEVLARPAVLSVSPTQEATEQWLETIREGMPGTVWASGCSSWYVGNGQTPVLWPFDRRSWLELLRTPQLADYEIETVKAPAPARVAA